MVGNHRKANRFSKFSKIDWFAYTRQDTEVSLKFKGPGFSGACISSCRSCSAYRADSIVFLFSPAASALTDSMQQYPKRPNESFSFMLGLMTWCCKDFFICTSNILLRSEPLFAKKRKLFFAGAHFDIHFDKLFRNPVEVRLRRRNRKYPP